jgi:hypothetical protein
MAGCGGGSNDGSASSPPLPSGGSTTLRGDGGIWAGTVSAPGAVYDNYDIIGVYTKSGESRFWIYNGEHGGPGFLIAPGAMTPVTNNEFSGSYQGFGNDLKLPNGSNLEHGDIEVTVNTKDGSLSGDFISSGSGAAQDNASFTSLTFERTIYHSGSSQSDLVANGGSYGFQFNLPKLGAVSGSLLLSPGLNNKAADTITGTDTSGCSYSGTASAISSRYDAYDVTLARVCSGSSALQLSGLGVFYPAGAITSTSAFDMLLDDSATLGVEIIAE